MRFYLYRPDPNRFAAIGFGNADGKAVVDAHYSDKPLADRWVAPVAHGYEDNPETEGDFPSISNFSRAPTVTKRAWDLLQPLIGYCCEALPIAHPSKARYVIIHVMDTIDCLDHKRSRIKRFGDGGIMYVVAYALDQRKGEGRQRGRQRAGKGDAALFQHEEAT